MTSELAIPAIKIASIPAAMRSLDRLEVNIKNAPTLEILNALADAAAGFQRRWKPVKDIADRAGECVKERDNAHYRDRPGALREAFFCQLPYATVLPAGAGAPAQGFTPLGVAHGGAHSDALTGKASGPPGPRKKKGK